LLERTESTKELKAIAEATPSEPAAQTIPGLAKCALRVGPFGIEGGDPKPNEASDWLALTRAARAPDSPLVRSWPIPPGYEGNKSVQSVSYGGGWTAKLLGARLESVLRDDAATTDLKEVADVFPVFAARAAFAIHVGRSAKDESDVTKARDLLAEAVKLKREGQPFGEGALALAYLAAKSASIARTDLAKWRE